MAPMRIKRPQTVNEFVALTHSTTNSHTDESAKHTSYNKQHATYQGIAFYYVQDDKLVYFLNDNIYELPLEGKTQVEEIKAYKSGNCTFQHLTGCIHQEKSPVYTRQPFQGHNI